MSDKWMMIYKSVRYIDEKPRWIVEDEYGNIIKDPTKEQLKLAVLESSDAYHSLMEFLKYKKNFGIEDIKKFK